MFTHHRNSLSLVLLLALGAPQLLGCDTSSAAASAPTAEESASPTAPATSAQSAQGAPERAPAEHVAPSPASVEIPSAVAPPVEAQAARAAGATGAHGANGASVDGLGVRRLVVAHAVEEREPIGAERAFTANQDRVYAFVDARNRGADDQDISVVFEGPQGQSAGHVALNVPGNRGRWRTWGYTRNISAPGTWHAVVRSAEGVELARQAFEVR